MKAFTALVIMPITLMFVAYTSNNILKTETEYIVLLAGKSEGKISKKELIEATSLEIIKNAEKSLYAEVIGFSFILSPKNPTPGFGVYMEKVNGKEISESIKDILLQSKSEDIIVLKDIMIKFTENETPIKYHKEIKLNIME